MGAYVINIGYPYNVSLVFNAANSLEASTKADEWCEAHDYALDGIQVMMFELNDRIYSFMRPTLYGYAQFVFGEWRMCTNMYTSIDELNEVEQGSTDGLKLVEVKPGDPEYDELYKAFCV